MKISCKINGNFKEFETSHDESVLVLLRRYNFKGVKFGCKEGYCGACSIILDGKLVSSCLLLAPQIDGHEIELIEGRGDMKTDIIQETFIEEGAIQCGYCTPGMVLATRVLISRNNDPSEDEIKDALSGNLCRCTGYVKIEKAVKKAAKKIRERDGNK